MVENLDNDSGLFDADVENNLKKIRQFCEDSGLPPWHPPKKVGFFRFLTVRKSYATDQILASLVTSSDGIDEFDFDGVTELFKELFGDRLAGLLHTVNDQIADRTLVTEGTSRLLYGKDVLVEHLLDLELFQLLVRSFLH